MALATSLCEARNVMKAALETGSNEETLETVQNLLSAWPGVALYTEFGIDLSLHTAARCQSGVIGAAVIRALLDAAPSAAMAATEYGSLAIHIMAGNSKATVAMMIEILRRCPRLAKVEDEDGNLPLHLAARRQSGAEGAAIISALVKAYPGSQKRYNQRGMLPIHIAAESQRGRDGAVIINTLLRLAPGTAMAACTTWGKLPLHIAAAEETDDPAIVQALLKAAPEAAITRAPCIGMPLHHALMEGNTSKAIIDTLIRTAPSVLTTPIDKKGSSLPIHIAAAKLSGEKGAAIVQMLLDAAPQTIRKGACDTELYSCIDRATGYYRKFDTPLYIALARTKYTFNAWTKTWGPAKNALEKGDPMLTLLKCADAGCFMSSASASSAASTPPVQPRDPRPGTTDMDSPPAYSSAATPMELPPRYSEASGNVDNQQHSQGRWSSLCRLWSRRKGDRSKSALKKT